MKTVGFKWVFKKKEGISGIESIRYRTRLVAKGYSQREDVEFNKVFSQVVKHDSIHVLLVILAS